MANELKKRGYSLSQAFKKARAHVRNTMKLSNIVKEVPIWEKSNLTVEEAAAYTGIGINKIREMTNGDNCPFKKTIFNIKLSTRSRVI